jgi:predicted lipid-binding transport protein (Tim44 family)
MAISTIIVIAFFAVAAVLLFVALGVVVRRRRTAHRRVQAGDIRDRAAEQSHTVGQREALAEETAAQARVAQAEGDAKTAHAAGLKHQAQALRSDAATARDDVKKDFERADTIDPDSQTHDTPGQDTGTRETPPGTPGDTHGPRPMRRAG